MTTLFERIVNPPFDPEAADSKIPVTAMHDLIKEFMGGHITLNDISGTFNLTVAQDSEVQDIIDFLNVTFDSASLFILILRLWKLGEIGVLPSIYRDEPTFLARLIAHG